MSALKFSLHRSVWQGPGAAPACAAWILGALALGLSPTPSRAGEVFIGALAHDFDSGLSSAPREGHTTDIELGLRSQPLQGLRYILRPMAYVQAELNTGRRTNFYAVGLEWRRDLPHTRLYGAFNLGLAAVDGYVNPPNYTSPGLDSAQVARNRYLYETNKAMGSDVVFNPGLSAGLRITSRLAMELTWQHYSNAGLFGKENPGMDNIGARAVYRFGGRG